MTPFNRYCGRHLGCSAVKRLADWMSCSAPVLLARLAVPRAAIEAAGYFDRAAESSSGA